MEIQKTSNSQSNLALSEAEFAPFRLWLAPTCPCLLPLAGDGLVCSRLTLLCTLFCEQAGCALG